MKYSEETEQMDRQCELSYFVLIFRLLWTSMKMFQVFKLERKKKQKKVQKNEIFYETILNH